MNLPTSVLLADDEAHIRKYVGLILKQLGVATILEATNGQQAIETYERERPALVLLDVNMPVVDGLEALRKIRELNPASAVVMLTSLTTRGAVETALELGAANYIRKDTSREELTATLTETIHACFASEESP